MSDIMELYHNCASCHWFDRKTGECLHENTFAVSDLNPYELSENGDIVETVKECFDSAFKGLKINLEGYLSKKRAKEVMSEFYDELESKQDEWAQEIDKALSALVENYLEEVWRGKCSPDNPKEFYCKYFE